MIRGSDDKGGQVIRGSAGDMGGVPPDAESRTHWGVEARPRAGTGACRGVR